VSVSYRKLTYIFLSLILGYFTLCSSPSINNWQIRQFESAPSQLIFFGDSLTKGYGLKDLSKSFPERISQEMDLPFKRFGFSGYTTMGAIEKLKLLKNEEPSLLIITLGGNDILKSRTLNETETSLREIFTYAQNYKHTLVFTEVLKVFDSDRHEMHIKLCREFGVLLIPDILAGVVSKPELMVDFIHPNEKGSAVISEKILKILREHHFDRNL